MSSLLIRRVASVPILSGSRNKFPFVTTLLVTELTLSQKLEAICAPVDPFDAANILGRHLCFFRFWSDFIAFYSRFPIPALSEWSRLHVSSLEGTLNSGDSSCYSTPLANSRQFLSTFLNFFSSADFISFYFSQQLAQVYSPLPHHLTHPLTNPDHCVFL